MALGTGAERVAVLDIVDLEGTVFDSPGSNVRLAGTAAESP